jgi:hypothetical protein
MDKKSRDILKAITAGQSCDQILARDGTVTQRDIFHAAAGAPTRFWKKTSAKHPHQGQPVKRAAQRTD